MPTYWKVRGVKRQAVCKGCDATILDGTIAVEFKGRKETLFICPFCINDIATDKRLEDYK